MKKYYRYPEGTNDSQVQVGLDVVLGDAVLELVEAGIGEDAHFWSQTWRDIDSDDLEWALQDSSTIQKMLSYINLALVDKLHEALASIREEEAREAKRNE